MLFKFMRELWPIYPIETYSIIFLVELNFQQDTVCRKPFPGSQDMTFGKSLINNRSSINELILDLHLNSPF